MREAALEIVEKRHDSSFSVIAYENPFFAAPWHIHAEYELILIEEGAGVNFVGDSVRRMHPGELMLIGSNLPHLWLSSDEYYKPDSGLLSRSVYTQFEAEIFPGGSAGMPELGDVFSLLKDSERGLVFHGGDVEALKDDFRALVHAVGFARWNGLCCLLHGLATRCRRTPLATEKFCRERCSAGDPLVQRVHQFINMNYQDRLTLEDIASHVGMNPSALCRCYKRRTGRKIFEYLSELRISYAVKLLANRNITVGQVAYDCGYNSLSHFNRQFKDITGYAPSDYLRLVLGNS